MGLFVFISFSVRFHISQCDLQNNTYRKIIRCPAFIVLRADNDTTLLCFGYASSFRVCLPWMKLCSCFVLVCKQYGQLLRLFSVASLLTICAVVIYNVMNIISWSRVDFQGDVRNTKRFFTVFAQFETGQFYIFIAKQNLYRLVISTEKYMVMRILCVQSECYMYNSSGL